METEVFQFEPAGARLIPARLKEAREAKGLSQTDIAKLADITPQAISQYESGDKQPEWNTLMTISKHLELPVGYFTSERPPGGESTTTAFFRSFKSRTKATHKMLRWWSIWAAQIISYIGSVVNLPPVSIPKLPDHFSYSDDEIEKIATECRRLWGLADGPIASMIALLESKGFIVVRSAFGVDNADAFSCWQDNRPFIFLATDKNCAVRSRFDAAHELGHMILHRHIPQDEIENPARLNEIEHQANRFAAAFLMPAKTFISEIYSSNLKQFVELKKRWKVAIGAMIYRCKDLGVFDEQLHINLRKQMSFYNWIKREPLDDEIQIEQTQLIAKAVKLMIDSGVKAVTDFIVDLQLSVSVLVRIGNIDAELLAVKEEQITYPLGLRQR